MLKIATIEYSTTAHKLNETWVKVGNEITKLKPEEEIFLENYNDDDATCDVMPILNDENIFIDYLERTKYNPLDILIPEKCKDGKSLVKSAKEGSNETAVKKEKEIILNQERSFFELRVKPTEAKYDDYVCQVCSEGDTADGNLIVFCSKCSITVHQKCYG